jgi:glycosyltransferase involved in cell wall biosynthesis
MQTGRRLASATVVAAGHLADPGDLVVGNVPSATVFPHPEHVEPRNAVVYVGDITEARGICAMLEIVRRVPDVRLELIGSIAPALAERVRERAERDGTLGRITLTGRLPYEEAWARAAGALAGLSLLSPTPAYRAATPSKLWEYMAAGIPIVASDLPAQRELIEASGAGVIVDGPEAAAAVVARWSGDPHSAEEFGFRGRAHYETVVAGSDATSALRRAVLGSP